jgi:WD40 repeat protein
MVALARAEYRLGNTSRTSAATAPVPDCSMSVLLDSILLDGHPAPIYRIAMLPGGMKVATISGFGQVYIHSTITGECLLTLGNYNDMYAGLVRGSLVALGGEIVACGDWLHGLHVWDASTGTQLHSDPESGGIRVLAVVSENQFVAGVAGDLVFFAHRNGRDLVQQHEVMRAHSSSILGISVSGTRIATASEDGTVAVWNIDASKRLAVLKEDPFLLIEVAMSSRYVVTLSSHCGLRVYDADTLQPTCVLDIPRTSSVSSLTLVGHSHVLFSLGHVGEYTQAQLTALPTGAKVACTKLPFPAESVCFSQDGWVGAARSGKEPAAEPVAVLLPPLPVATSIYSEHVAAMRHPRSAKFVKLALVVSDRLR